MIEINFAHTNSIVVRLQRIIDSVRLTIATDVLVTAILCLATMIAGATYLYTTQHALARIVRKETAQAPIIARLTSEKRQLDLAIKARIATDAAERANGTMAYALATQLAHMPTTTSIASLTADASGTTIIVGNARSSAASFAVARLMSPNANIIIARCTGLCPPGTRRSYTITNPSTTPTPAAAIPSNQTPVLAPTEQPS